MAGAYVIAQQRSKQISVMSILWLLPGLKEARKSLLLSPWIDTLSRKGAGGGGGRVSLSSFLPYSSATMV